MNYRLTDLLLLWLKEKHGHKEFQVKILRKPIDINFSTATVSVYMSEKIKVVKGDIEVGSIEVGSIEVYPVTNTNAPARVSVFSSDRRTLWVNPEEPGFLEKIERHLEL